MAGVGERPAAAGLPRESGSRAARSPTAALGICSMRVKAHIPLKLRPKRKFRKRVGSLLPDHSPESLMQQVHQKRMALKLSQTELANLLGFDRASISRWELGIKSPRNRARRKLVEWLEFDLRSPEG